MDFSQLPKMSKTPGASRSNEPADEVEPAADIALEGVAQAEAEASRRTRPVPMSDDFGLAPFSYVSVWISLIAGVIFLAMGQTFARYLIARLGGHEFSTGLVWGPGPKSGPIGYFELAGGTAWSDCGFFTMGIALLLDAGLIALWAARKTPNRALILLTLAVTGLALVINIGVVGYLFSIGIMPIMSLMAVMVGGFVLFDHVPLLKRGR